jgi:hypothetical protein
LTSDLNLSTTKKLIAVLEQKGLVAESNALEIYLTPNRNKKVEFEEWGNRPCTVSLDLPNNPEPGDLWFDPVELNFSTFIPNLEGTSHHVSSWVSTHPVYVWQYRTFLSLVKIGRKLDNHAVPTDYLRATRIKGQSSLSYVTNIYYDEAIAYSSWMRKSLCGQSNLEAAKRFLCLEELDKILPGDIKLWDSGEFQEEYIIAVGRNSIDKNPSLDYEVIARGVRCTLLSRQKNTQFKIVPAQVTS